MGTRVAVPKARCLLGILGFSARFTGGGGPIGALEEASLRDSPELRGGGSGGCEKESEGDLRKSNNGVCGRLGILKWRGDDEPVVKEDFVSLFVKEDG
jgi:hypothetical protein